MTEDQKELREERIAIITVEGVSSAEATKCCDAYPWMYGKSEQKVVQEALFEPDAMVTMGW